VGVRAILAVPLLRLGVFHAFGLYRPQHLGTGRVPPRHRRHQRRDRTAGDVSYWSNSSFSRGWIGLTWLLTLLLELGTRQAWHWHMYRLRLAGRLAYRTLVVGMIAEADRLCEILSREGFGILLLGYVRPRDQS
jgi:hypothetical protein